MVWQLLQVGEARLAAAYDNAQHGFFNDTGTRYNETAAKQAQGDMLAWFAQHLA